MPTGRTALLALVLAFSALTLAAAATAGRVPKHIVFPVVGKVAYQNDYGDPRSQGSHEGNDIMGIRRQVAVAAEAGRVEKRRRGSSSCYLFLHGRSGTDYWYIHLNNDQGRGNDNKGGCRNGIAWPRGLRNGQRVRAGAIVGFVGDSGDADGIQPHLHFEVHPNGGRSVNPFRHLNRAYRLVYAERSSVKSVAARMRGTVRATSPRLTIRVRLVKLSTGRYFRVTKTVALDVLGDAVIERKTAQGEVSVASLAGAEPGDRATVWTKHIVPSLANQRALPGKWDARRVRFLN
jgi:hypothetical protein